MMFNNKKNKNEIENKKYEELYKDNSAIHPIYYFGENNGFHKVPNLCDKALLNFGDLNFSTMIKVADTILNDKMISEDLLLNNMTVCAELVYNNILSMSTLNFSTYIDECILNYYKSLSPTDHLYIILSDICIYTKNKFRKYMMDNKNKFLIIISSFMYNINSMMINPEYIKNHINYIENEYIENKQKMLSQNSDKDKKFDNDISLYPVEMQDLVISFSMQIASLISAYMTYTIHEGFEITVFDNNNMYVERDKLIKELIDNDDAIRGYYNYIGKNIDAMSSYIVLYLENNMFRNYNLFSGTILINIETILLNLLGSVYFFPNINNAKFNMEIYKCEKDKN